MAREEALSIKKIYGHILSTTSLTVVVLLLTGLLVVVL